MGFVWKPGGAIEGCRSDRQVDLPPIGGSQSHGFDINSSGDVVGWSTNANPSGSVLHATLRGADGSPIDLGTLATSSFSATSAADYINDAGQVAGWSQSDTGLTSHAFQWSATTGMVDLNTAAGIPETTATLVRGLSEAGQVLITAETRAGAAVDAGQRSGEGDHPGGGSPSVHSRARQRRNRGGHLRRRGLRRPAEAIRLAQGHWSSRYPDPRRMVRGSVVRTATTATPTPGKPPPRQAASASTCTSTTAPTTPSTSNSSSTSESQPAAGHGPGHR